MGRKLKSIRHSACFEILALAYLHSKKLSKAIAILEEGVSKAGRVWVLWELLGNCYSYDGQFGKAERAYQKALLQDGCNVSVVHLNRSIAFNRAGKFAKAKSVLDLVNSPEVLHRAQACRIRNELALGNFASAKRLALKLCKIRRVDIEHYDDESATEILVACALALKGAPKAKGMALRFAFKAVEIEPNNAEVLAVIREINQRRQTRPILYHVILQGTWNTPIGKAHNPPGFFRTFEIAAPTEKEAFRYAKPFFPKAIRNSLSMDEAKIITNTTPVLEGVHFLSSYHFYPNYPKRKRT